MLLVFLAVLWELSDTQRVYQAKNYDDILRDIDDVNGHFANSPAVVISDAIDLRRTPQPWLCMSDGIEKPCRSPLLRISLLEPAEIAEPVDDRPGLLISGAIHGNERIGPTIALELGRVLARGQSADDPYFKWLLLNRDIWILPFANAFGFSRRVREDEGVDPNRDFPYLNGMQCFRSNTAKLIDSVVHQKIFLAGITFHGGMRSLSYPWGSFNHVRRGPRGRMTSTEAPDFAAFHSLARQMQKASGPFPKVDGTARTISERVAQLQSLDATQSLNEQELIDFGLDPVKDANYTWFYPIASTTESVYPLNGASEDWAYGGGWEARPNPIGACPASYHTPKDPGQGLDPHLSFPLFLAETDDLKDVPTEAYGEEKEFAPMNPLAGHIPRNVKMALKLAEMLRPELLFSVEHVTEPNMHATGLHLLEGKNARSQVDRVLDFVLQGKTFEVDQESPQMQIRIVGFFVGCETAHSMKVLLRNEDDTEIWSSQQKYKCGSLSVFDNENPSGFELILDVPQYISGTVILSSNFDEDWSVQANPDPPTTPQSHISKIRLQEHYDVESWGLGRLSHTKTVRFPRFLFLNRTAEVYQLPQTPESVLRATLPLVIRRNANRLRRRHDAAEVDVVCHPMVSSPRQAQCVVRCIDCERLSSTLGSTFNLSLSARRSYWKGRSVMSTRSLQEISLGSFESVNGEWHARLPFQVNTLKGRVLSLTPDFNGNTQAAALDVLSPLAVERGADEHRIEYEPMREKRREERIGPGSEANVSPLLCLFRPGNSLLYYLPGRERLTLRLRKTMPEVATLEIPVHQLISSLGYMVLIPPLRESARLPVSLVPLQNADRFYVTGKFCFPNLPSDETIYIRPRQGNCVPPVIAEQQKKTLLNPFASRIMEAANSIDYFDCKAGDQLEARTNVSGIGGYDCSLSLLRLGDIKESGAEAATQVAHLIHFLDEAVCSRVAVEPPTSSRTFSAGQLSLISGIGAVFGTLTVLQAAEILRRFPHPHRKPSENEAPSKAWEAECDSAKDPDSTIRRSPMGACPSSRGKLAKNTGAEKSQQPP